MRRFIDLPAIPANNATIVLFATHPKTPSGGTLYQPPSGITALIKNHFLDAITAWWAQHNKASAANGLRVWATDDGGTNWFETDLKDDNGVPSVGSAAPVQVPALASGQECRETFIVSHLRGVALEYTAGADNPENWDGGIVLDLEEQTIGR